MFVQVFQAKIRDADLWARRVEKWRTEIQPKTTGFLGFTSGISPDGYMITVVRFKSEETAQVDNDLPEQGAWFEETSKAFDGEATFHGCREVDILLDGGSNDAGFVQVMQGRAKDQERMRTQQKEMQTKLRKVRPDLIGGITVGTAMGTLPKLPTSPQSKKRARTSRPWHRVRSTSSSCRSSMAT